MKRECVFAGESGLCKGRELEWSRKIA